MKDATAGLAISNGKILLPDGALLEGNLLIEGDRISRVGGRSPASGHWDAQGLLVLPGIVDLHGDAFERQIMPRPGVHFSTDLALIDTDRQMAANGITTAYHGITYSWEPGLRGRDTVIELLDALDLLSPRLSVDTKVHLRHENHNLDGIEDILHWLEQGRLHLLAFNEHLPDIQSKADDVHKLAKYADRTGLSAAAFSDLLERVARRGPQVPAANARLAATARAHGVAMASHDDVSPEMRLGFRNLGVDIAEFPINAETAMAARRAGDAIILGAPNVLRGGSHCGRLGAKEAISQGLCTVLTSDYFYPALNQAPFRLARELGMSLGDTWAMVSSNPARAAGLNDRGRIEEGCRADLTILDISDPSLPRVVATLVAGRLAFGSGRLGL
ncbi:MAG: alpha-D-ribose 1-methylphosphonate 5-triphosphate diphosphatase [Magnetovibrionaceae bacterium]